MAVFLLVLALLACVQSSSLAADASNAHGLNDWWSIAGNFEVGFRKTQYFESDHDALVGMWDSRLEFWLPPFKNTFSWGPYVRIAGIGASRDQPWENAWLAGPGLGLQIYPFSVFRFRTESSWAAKILGPIRLFSEYNWLNYWGSENDWRPDHQIRVGTEYWCNLHANNLTSPWWAEIWGGLYWQSANEFDEHYDTLNFATSLRSGIRMPNSGILSMISPYVMLESCLNENESYYWENRLLVGGGVRITPSLEHLPNWLNGFMNRIVLYAEYDYALAYYHTSAPSNVPDHDIRVGLSFSFGDWYY